MTTPTLPAAGIPSPDDPVSSAEHWGWLRRHELRVQRCSACGTTRTPPAEVCHACYAVASTWQPIPAVGTVFSWTRIWHAASDELVGHTPYVVVWVEIDHPGRPRFLGNLLGDPDAPVRIGDAVTGVFEDRDGGTILNWERTP